jgi:tetratricopeptide (TPR) repeat protein
VSKQLTALFAVGGLALLGGCASDVGRMASTLDEYDAAIELTSVPFYPQTTDQCGPAALATILNVTGVDTDPDALRALTYIPGRQGSLQTELLSATRSYRRIPYPIDPTIDGLLAELEAKRPVLILQNLGTGMTPIWHYAVVVGYLPEDRVFILRSGDKERHRIKRRPFLRSWKRADYWGFIAMHPRDLPAVADAAKYLRAIAALESAGDVETAREAYQAATQHWPGNALAWLALGNASYAGGDLEAAQHAYETSVKADSNSVIALNNLSQVYLERGQLNDAEATIHAALSMVDADDPLHGLLLQTAAAIAGP